ncbi:signal peptidase II [Dissulfuribacter thermophilus]|uniref:signal peptidase II n=1 Tax=Dissulfuribacter thermophilus TaxID=1156395 RepID=UPI001FC9B4EB
MALDQVTKWYIVKNFNLFESKVILDGFFNLTYITNTGAAFGILSGTEKWRNIFFQAITVMALCGMIYLYKTMRTRSGLFLWGLSLVFGGALGNFIDRVRFGYVVDFLDFYVGSWHWPAFNVADSCISLGATMLAVYFLRETV